MENSHNPTTEGGVSYEVWGEPDEHECSDCDALIGERDEAQEAADRLAQCIADMLGVDIGEHSNLNCPWKNAAEFGEAVAAGRATGTKREAEAIRLLQSICDAASKNGAEKPWPVKYAAPFGEIAAAMEFLQSIKPE